MDEKWIQTKLLAVIIWGAAIFRMSGGFPAALARLRGRGRWKGAEPVHGGAVGWRHGEGCTVVRWGRIPAL